MFGVGGGRLARKASKDLRHIVYFNLLKQIPKNTTPKHKTEVTPNTNFHHKVKDV